jgi:OTU domain-containing protein 6
MRPNLDYHGFQKPRMGKRRKGKHVLPAVLDSEVLEGEAAAGQKEEQQDTEKELASEVREENKQVQQQQQQQQQPQRKSKKERQRERRLAQERAQQEEVERLRANIVDHNAIERLKLGEKLAPVGLRIAEVPADGHCLFRSCVEQLELAKDRAYLDLSSSGVSNKDEKDISTMDCVRGLRGAVAAHMRAHSGDFEPFFDAESIALASDTDDRPATFDAYCDTVANTSCWGGQLELRAIVEVVGRRIEVFHAQSDTVVMGEGSTEGDGEPLRLSFHLHAYNLGTHYNAVIPRA